MTTATRADPAAIERTPEDWRRALFPATYSGPLAAYHEDYWRWLWEITAGQMPRPYLAVWPRGWAKSTSAEDGCVYLGATRKRLYGLYVSGTQQQADNHVQSIGARLESETVARWYPQLAERAVNQYGSSRGWRRSRLWTAQGFVLDALGLDVAMRGAKLGDARPDLIILDDIDDSNDSPETIAKKAHELTHKILPAGSPDVAVMVLQNLVHRNGIVAQLVDGRADFLARRILSGPHPAILDLETEGTGKDAVILSGEPTWAVLGLRECQEKIGLMGLTAFLAECQHDVALTGNPRFNLERLSYLREQCREPLPDKLLPAHMRGIEGLRVYELPRPGVGYVQYTDPAEGKGRDACATGWMDARTRTLVCVLEDTYREPQVHADIACNVGEWFNEPLTGFERAKGEAMALVFGARGVRRIYQHEDNPLTPQQRAAGIERKLRPGYPMTEHSKRGLIDRLGEHIESLSVVVPDKRTVGQLGDYLVTERNKLAAAAGSHDDLVLMLAGLVMLAEQPGAQATAAKPIVSSGSYGYVAPGRQPARYGHGRA